MTFFTLSSRIKGIVIFLQCKKKVKKTPVNKTIQNIVVTELCENRFLFVLLALDFILIYVFVVFQLFV